MPETLYRKYRPQRFADLVGQQHIRVTLTNELKSGRLAHAYLLTGPRGVGKTTVARLLARSVNCTGRKPGEAEPDNACPACRSILAGRALDMIEVDAASQTGVDNVRENIIANARVAPTTLAMKVFIIDEVHMLSAGAFNALLKLLEEPPAHALLILATTEVHKVPETIISRCQRFDFHRVSVDDLRRRLATLTRAEQVEVADDVLEDVARRSEGSVRDGESMLGQLLALGEKRITLAEAAIVLPRTDARAVIGFLTHMARRDAGGAIAALTDLVEEGVSLPHFVHQVVELARVLFLRAVNPTLERTGAVALDAKEEQALLELAPSFSVDQLMRILSSFRDLERQVKADPIPQLPVELAVLEALPDAVPVTTPVAPPPAPTATKRVTSSRRVSTAKADPAVPGRTKSAASTVTLAAVTAVWPKILEAVRERNRGLVVSLQSAVPVTVEDGTLVLGVRFPFHAERLNARKHQIILEGALEAAVGAPLTVRCQVAASAAVEGDGAVSDIAKAFGGEVLP